MLRKSIAKGLSIAIVAGLVMIPYARSVYADDSNNAVKTKIEYAKTKIGECKNFNDLLNVLNDPFLKSQGFDVGIISKLMYFDNANKLVVDGDEINVSVNNYNLVQQNQDALLENEDVQSVLDAVYARYTTFSTDDMVQTKKYFDDSKGKYIGEYNFDNLPVSTIVIGNRAYDAKYLFNKNNYAKLKEEVIDASKNYDLSPQFNDNLGQVTVSKNVYYNLSNQQGKFKTISVSENVYGNDFDSKDFNVGGLIYKDENGKEYKVNSMKVELAIRSQLYKPSGTITEEDLKSIKKLDLSNANIEDLRGIEKLTNLEELDLWNNKINDISALSNLQNLRYLDLDNNDISDLNPILKLQLLEYLNLDLNKRVLDISPLFKLNNLQIVSLRDLSILGSGIESLKSLGIEVEHNEE